MKSVSVDRSLTRILCAEFGEEKEKLEREIFVDDESVYCVRKPHRLQYTTDVAQ